MSECEAHWLMDFPPNNLLGARQEIIMVISQKSKQTSIKEKLVILQLIGIIAIKSKETRVITYTCRYSSEPNSS